MPVPTLLITGPAGVGKTTVAFEVAEVLKTAGVSHALVDADELDRIHPAPPGDPHKTALTARNLGAVWENLRAAGAARLILVMVATSLDYELPWIRAAVPDAAVTVVGLRASEKVLMERVRRREIGSAGEHQARRTLEQSRAMAREPGAERLLVETSGRPVAEVAREVIERCGWLTGRE